MQAGVIGSYYAGLRHFYYYYFCYNNNCTTTTLYFVKWSDE
jgi:hypothetical protein